MNTKTSLTLRVLALGLTGLLLAACAAPAPAGMPAGGAPAFDSRFESAPMAAMPAATEAPAATAAPAAPAAPASSTNSPDVALAQPRLIIRTADLAIVVTNTVEQISAISKLAGQYGGFVVSSGTSQMGDATQGQIMLRVGAANFEAALSDIRALAVSVQNESVRGEDVTAEFVDLDAQVKNLEAAEAQLQEILKQATKTEDVLNVYRELTNIRGQIDQMKGRMKFLSQSAALSTINVQLIPDALAQPVQVGGWQPVGVAKAALEALIASLQGLVNIAIWLGIVVLPIVLICTIPMVVLIALIRRSRRGKAVKSA